MHSFICEGDNIENAQFHLQEGQPRKCIVSSVRGTMNSFVCEDNLPSGGNVSSVWGTTSKMHSFITEGQPWKCIVLPARRTPRICLVFSCKFRKSCPEWQLTSNHQSVVPTNRIFMNSITQWMLASYESHSRINSWNRLPINHLRVNPTKCDLMPLHCGPVKMS